MNAKTGPPADLTDLDTHDEGTHNQHHKQMRYALRFSAAYGETLMFVKGLGWHRWTGSHWALCEDGAEKRAVRKLLHHHLRQIVKMDDTDGKKLLLKEAIALESDGGVAGVLTLARAERNIGAVVKELDASPLLLNTPTGVINLETGDVTPNAPADRLTKVTAAGFDPDATSETFTKFLETIQPDPEIRGFLARSLGASLLGEVRDQRLYIWHGAGANGKGTLRDAVSHALGSYVCEVSTSLLLQSKYGEQATMNGRLDLLGTRIAFCSEIPKGAKLDEATMKNLTGGDPVKAKKLYQDEIVFDPSHQLVMLTNYLPDVSGDDPAVWRRMVAVPFPVNIPESDWDVQLSKKLREAAPAVLAWLYEGWQDYQKNGLNIPDAVRAYTESYQDASDALGNFLEESTITNPHMFVASADLFQKWSDYCSGEGTASGTKTAFGKAMRSKGFGSEKKGGKMVYTGLGLAAQDDDEDDIWKRRRTA